MNIDLLNTFNVVAGVVTIASLAFSIWVYARARRREAIDAERARSYHERLQAVHEILAAALEQQVLVVEVADRDDTTKKELKHLAVNGVALLTRVQNVVSRGLDLTSHWASALPARYLTSSAAASELVPDPE